MNSVVLFQKQGDPVVRLGQDGPADCRAIDSPVKEGGKRSFLDGIICCFCSPQCNKVQLGMLKVRRNPGLHLERLDRRNLAVPNELPFSRTSGSSARY